MTACAPSGGRIGHFTNPDASHAPDDDAGVVNGTDSGTTTGGMTFAAMCSGSSTTLTGVVKAPNGMDPIANALVYVPSSMSAFPAGVSCELCDSPTDAQLAQTTSAADGSFTLDIGPVPAASQVSFTISKGRFRRNTMLSVTPCMANTVAAPHDVLPGKAAPGDDIPKIAVATGNKDQLDVVLASMGLDSSAGFDCYEGRKSTTSTLSSPCGMHTGLQPIETLLSNATMLDAYNIVFLSCAPGKFASLPAATQTAITSNLQAWTQKGGRLFATDNSYDYVAQAFPMNVTFMNGTTVDSANVGVGGSSSMPTQYTGQINDATLATWLGDVGAITKGTNTMMLGGYLNDWSVIQAVPMGTTDEVDATNAVAYTAPGGTTKGAAMSYPQTVKFDIAPSGSMNACGRVIYTSYHTLPTTTTVSAANLAPQERILEYLMFEAGACLTTIQ